MDTVCRYWPWLERLDSVMASKQKPLLSVMHAKSHSWGCQVSFCYHPIDSPLSVCSKLSKDVVNLAPPPFGDKCQNQSNIYWLASCGT